MFRFRVSGQHPERRERPKVAERPEIPKIPKISRNNRVPVSGNTRVPEGPSVHGGPEGPSVREVSERGVGRGGAPWRGRALRFRFT